MKIEDKIEEINKRMEKLILKIKELEKSRDYWLKEVRDLEILAINKMKSTSISFEVHLSEHCNLNCKGCDHFSPLAKPEFPDFKSFSNDMEQMSKIFKAKADTIHLLGGEPLLNNDIIKFILKTRECFPDSGTTKIKLITNGILLNSMSEQFWKTCFEKNITISVTKYPLKLDYKKMSETAKKSNVNFEFYDNTDQEQVWYDIKLKTSGNQDPKRSFFKCFLSNKCVMLKNGKLYTCTLIPNIEHFNRYFDKDLKVCDKDYIDIYKVKDEDEIFEFLSNPIPFCRYCNPEEKDYSLKWEKSKRDIDEWI